MEYIIKKRNFLFIMILFIGIYSCKNNSGQSFKQIISEEDVDFWAFMLKGSDYSAQLRVFIKEGELDCHIINYNELGLSSIDFQNLSTICSSGKNWDDVVMLNSSNEVANYLKKKMTVSTLDCIDIKVASFSTPKKDSINYILYLST